MTPTWCLCSTPRMYADDTCFTLSARDPEDLQSQLNSDLVEIQTWLQASKLSLNVKKTKLMIMGSHYRLSHIEHNFHIKVDDRTLERVKTYKYLGVELDETLTWHSHIDSIIKKVSGGLRALKRARILVPHETLIMMYKALVQPYFDYCSSIWGGIGKCQSERLQKLQNRAARIVMHLDFNIRSFRLFDDLG